VDAIGDAGGFELEVEDALGHIRALPEVLVHPIQDPVWVCWRWLRD
jgi:hypothetical protein